MEVGQVLKISSFFFFSTDSSIYRWAKKCFALFDTFHFTIFASLAVSEGLKINVFNTPHYVTRFCVKGICLWEYYRCIVF